MNTPIMKLATNSCNTIELLLKDKENNKALYDKLVLENEKLKEERDAVLSHLETRTSERNELKEENERIKDCFEICSNKSMCTIEDLEDSISVLQRAIMSYFNLEGQADLEDVLQFCRNEIDDLMPFNHSADDDDELLITNEHEVRWNE